MGCICHCHIILCYLSGLRLAKTKRITCFWFVFHHLYTYMFMHLWYRLCSRCRQWTKRFLKRRKRCKTYLYLLGADRHRRALMNICAWRAHICSSDRNGSTHNWPITVTSMLERDFSSKHKMSIQLHKYYTQECAQTITVCGVEKNRISTGIGRHKTTADKDSESGCV